jgi:Ni/Co efflux regulator RcnB
MKLKPAVCVALALSLASANFAFAQGRGDRGDNRDEKAQRHEGERHDMGRRGPPSWANNRHDVPRDYRHWNRGDRLPREYWDRQYVVDDWRGHHLRQPPRGYHWVQSGGDYLLVAIATGIIADLLLNH